MNQQLSRQIRNAFQTAVALATYEAKSGDVPVLDSKNFEKVARTAKQFERYLKGVTLSSDPEYARASRLRDDEFSPSYSSDNEAEERGRKRKTGKRTTGKRQKNKGRRARDSTDESSEDSKDAGESDSDSQSSDSSDRARKRKKV